MKKLDKIRKSKDTYLTKYVFKQIELIKNILNIPKNSRIYFLGYSHNFNYFLYKNKVIVSIWTAVYDEHKNLIVDSMEITDLYVITLFKEFKIFENVKQGKNQYAIDDFLNWIEAPSTINVKIDLPYYKIIKFLQGYNKTTFRTDNYLFYSKKDDEYCYTLNLYAKDLKNNAELKLYIPNKIAELDNGEWALVPPQNLRDFIAVDLSNKLSQNKIRQCKRAFLKFANEYCKELDTKNFYALELVKQVIQPVEYDRGWAVCRVFVGKNKFNNIWISDFMLENEKPYFMITDNPLSWKTTKIACIDIKTPTYHKARIKGNIYKQGIVKFKNWKLDKEYIKELIEFLKSPAVIDEYCTDIFKKYVTTNWQQLIFMYNHNTTEWGWDDEILPPDKTKGQIPFDTPIPNYMELLNDKD